jgi:hypothetical protein
MPQRLKPNSFRSSYGRPEGRPLQAFMDGLKAVPFKRRTMAQSDQLRVPEPARTDAKSFELLRVWIAHQDQHISLRVGVWKEPEHWGMMLADLARHIAAAFEQSEKRDPEETLARIKASFDTEMQSPTDEVRGEIVN